MVHHTETTQRERSADHWKLGRLLLDRWRRDQSEVNIELKRPTAIDPMLAESASGEPVDGNGAVKQLCGQVIYVTDDAVTVRRPSGAILVLDNDQILNVSGGQDEIDF